MIVIDAPNPRSSSRMPLTTRIRLTTYAVAAFIASACAAAALAGPAQAITDTLYGVYKDGANLECYTNSYYTDSSLSILSPFSWTNGTAGYSWNGDQVFSAAGAIFLRESGRLYRYVPTDLQGCTDSWSADSGTDVTPDKFTANNHYPYWLVKWMFGVSGSDLMYAVRDDGSLIRYTYNCHGLAASDPNCWSAEDTGGTGWNQLRNVGADFYGDIYGIAAEGHLRWYRYLGSGRWDSNSGAVVGSDIRNWSSCSQLAATGAGILYCVDSSTGGLYWYQHTGFDTGADVWHARSGTQVGWSWDIFSTVFAYNPPAAS